MATRRSSRSKSHSRRGSIRFAAAALLLALAALGAAGGGADRRRPARSCSPSTPPAASIGPVRVAEARYVAAFRHARGGQRDPLGTERGDRGHHAAMDRTHVAVPVVDWRASATRNGRNHSPAIERTPRQLFGGGTSISGAIDYSMTLFREPVPRRAARDRRLRRRLQQPRPAGHALARDEAVAAGARHQRPADPGARARPRPLYQDNVIGGPGAFVVAARLRDLRRGDPQEADHRDRRQRPGRAQTRSSPRRAPCAALNLPPRRCCRRSWPERRRAMVQASTRRPLTGPLHVHGNGRRPQGLRARARPLHPHRSVLAPAITSGTGKTPRVWLHRCRAAASSRRVDGKSATASRHTTSLRLARALRRRARADPRRGAVPAGSDHETLLAGAPPFPAAWRRCCPVEADRHRDRAAPGCSCWSSAKRLARDARQRLADLAAAPRR